MKNDSFDNIDIDSTIDRLKNMPKKEYKKLLRQSRKSEFVKHMERINRQEKSSGFKQWWANNWIAFLGLIFAFIAALPVIIEGIANILTHIM